jgi:hypothetical protein
LYEIKKNKMNIDRLTDKESHLLDLISDDMGRDMQWHSMPQQEVYTHLYGWDNPHMDINLLLTPREKLLLLHNGHDINNKLKSDTELLSRVRRLRKNPQYGMTLN